MVSWNLSIYWMGKKMPELCLIFYKLENYTSEKWGKRKQIKFKCITNLKTNSRCQVKLVLMAHVVSFYFLENKAAKIMYLLTPLRSSIKWTNSRRWVKRSIADPFHQISHLLMLEFSRRWPVSLWLLSKWAYVFIYRPLFPKLFNSIKLLASF